MSDKTEVIPRATTTTAVRESALEQEITIGGDMQVAAATEAARAEIEARYIIANKFPRNEDKFYEAIKRDCKRPSFAAVALYTKPVSKDEKITDLSIRFVEGAIRHWRHTDVAIQIIRQDEQSITIRVTVIDLETNNRISREALVPKTVERKYVKKGRRTLGMRENTYGEMVYVVEATPDELRNVIGAEASKLYRDNGKRILPRDVLDECRKLIDQTLADENAKDPDAVKKRMIDGFSELNISPTMLEQYLGHPLDVAAPAEVEDLRKVYTGIKEGTFNWHDLLIALEAEKTGEEQPTRRPSARERIMQQAPFTKPEEPQP